MASDLKVVEPEFSAGGGVVLASESDVFGAEYLAGGGVAGQVDLVAETVTTKSGMIFI